MDPFAIGDQLSPLTPERPEVLLAGIGGGGCHALMRMTRFWLDGPQTLGIDSDRQALEACSLPETLLVGESSAKGKGAGGDLAAGRMALEENVDRLRDRLSCTDVLFLVVTLGGGTGTGAAPLLAEAAKEMGALVVVFAALPFSFEGEQRQKQARLGLRDLRERSDALVVLPNDRLLEDENRAETFVQSFAQSDHMVGVGVRALWKLVTSPGLINVGFSDLRRIIEHTDGTCSFGYGAGEGPLRVEQAMQELLSNALTDRGAHLAKCSGMLVNILGGEDLRIAEVQGIMTQLKGLARDGCDIVMGVTTEKSMANEVYVTILSAEEWLPAEEGETEAAPTEAGEASAEGRTAGRRERKRRSRGPRIEQGRFDLEGRGKGRFKGVEPTLYRGQDLDVPTFIRKNIKISIEK